MTASRDLVAAQNATAGRASRRWPVASEGRGRGARARKPSTRRRCAFPVGVQIAAPTEPDGQPHRVVGYGPQCSESIPRPRQRLKGGRMQRMLQRGGTRPAAVNAGLEPGVGMSRAGTIEFALRMLDSIAGHCGAGLGDDVTERKPGL